jgi:TonB family protein
MSNDNKHINYNADDIQRYLQGKMTPQEMHAMESTALDDEFLADAIEGYALVEEDHKRILDGLKDSLAQKTSGKVVEMKKGGWKQWYRIAAALFILLGSAAIIYKYVFTNKQEEPQSVVAKQESKKETATDTTKNINTEPNSVSNAFASTETKPPVTFKEKEATTIVSDSTALALKRAPSEEKNNTDDRAKDEVAIVSKKAEESKTLVADKEVQANANYKFTQDKKAKAAANYDNVVTPATAGVNARFSNVTKNNQNLSETLNQNIFKGRVVNANNEPLPFAKISILNDSFKIGTYSDAKGNFNFISIDTILNVEAKSVGFSNQTGVLKSGLLANNKLVLTENSQPNADIVIKSDRVDRVKSLRDLLKDTSKLAEPEDGWGNYATYMANNLDLPGEIKINSQHGTVELSFTVDKNGVPQNINIDKSYSKQVDSEAIRLVKDGPKWKSRNRNKKGKVVVVF